MANEVVSAPTNGNFASQQSYGTAEHQLPMHGSHVTAATMNGASNGQSTSSVGTTSSSGAGDSSSGVSKDEVGWYFVEQYYTTMSRNPEKLHLFYSKRSQFVSGVEAEKVSVSVGQRAINERIKELDIHDCKVRVTNVDSQESFKNIVVQVIGEMSNKAAPHRKFAQTFVLAEQPNGYFVLNDIFRYISEDAEEEVDTATVQQPEASNAAAPEQEPKTLTSSEDPVAQNEDAELVDKKLQEEVVQHPDEDAVMEDETTEDEPVPEVQQAEDKSNSIATTESEGGDKMDVPAQDEQVAALAIQDIAAEKPKDPDPTPIASPPKPAKVLPVEDNSAPAAPPKPAAPKTWANLVAANRIASPAAPNTTSSTSPSSQSKAAQPPAVLVPALNTSTNEDSASQPQQSPGAGWQTAGQDSGKRLGRQQSVSGPSEKTTVLGYVKNVTDKVDASLLKATLTQYGRLEYFDVSRPKNCAFVEFADAAGYNAAVAANPHSIGGEQIYVEERRPRPTAYGGGFGGRGGIRGGRGGPEGRPSNQGRGGFQKDGGRGGFIPRGRGGNLTPRGRGMPQAA